MLLDGARSLPAEANETFGAEAPALLDGADEQHLVAREPEPVGDLLVGQAHALALAFDLGPVEARPAWIA